MGQVAESVKSIHTESLEANADLSAYQWHGVKMGANGEVAAMAAITDKPVGILTNDPDADGEEAQVLVVGRCPIVAGETITYDDQIRIDDSGHAMIWAPGTDTTAYVVGRCIRGGDSGEKIVAIVNFSGMARGDC